MRGTINNFKMFPKYFQHFLIKNLFEGLFGKSIKKKKTL
jgi:hypothetical protein